MTDRTEPVITDRELAERLRTSLWFVQEHCRRKAWPHLRTGKRQIRFTAKHVAAIEQLLEVGPEQPSPEPPAPGADNAWGRRGRGS